MAAVFTPTPIKPDAADFQKVRSERIQGLFQLDPEVKISFAGKHYTLLLNNWAVKGILKDTGHNLMSLGFTVEVMTDPNTLGSFLFWALQTKHPELDQEATDKLFTYRHYAYVIDRLKQAIAMFLPDMSDFQVDEAVGRTEENVDPQ
jgi:hypothetical protein